jgi:hypothetical protein
MPVKKLQMISPLEASKPEGAAAISETFLPPEGIQDSVHNKRL